MVRIGVGGGSGDGDSSGGSDDSDTADGGDDSGGGDGGTPETTDYDPVQGPGLGGGYTGGDSGTNGGTDGDGGGDTSGDGTDGGDPAPGTGSDYDPVQGPGLGTQPGEPTDTPTDTGDGGTDDPDPGTGDGYDPVQGPGLGTQPGEPTETPTGTDDDAPGTGQDYDPVQGPGLGTDPTPEPAPGTGPGYDPVQGPGIGTDPTPDPAPGTGSGYDPVQGAGIGTDPTPDPDPVNVVDVGPQDVTRSEFQTIQDQSEYDVSPSDIRLLDDGGWRYSQPFLEDQGLEYGEDVAGGEPATVVDVGTGDITRSQFERFQEETAADIDPSDLRVDDGEIGLSDEFRREQATVGTRFSPEDVFFTEGGELGIMPSARAEIEQQRETEAALQTEQRRDDAMEAQAERDIEAQAGGAVLASLAAGVAGERGAEVAQQTPGPLARAFSPFDAGERYDIDARGTTAEEAQLGDATTALAGMFGGRAGRTVAEGVTPDEGDPTIDVELSDEYIQEQREAAQAAQDGDEGGRGIIEGMLGPPGDIESAIGFAATDPVGAVTGAPGTLESEAGYAVSDPVGAITGAPGSIESGAGDVAFAGADITADAGGAVWDYAIDRQEEALGGLGAIVGPPGELEQDIGGAVEGAAQPVIGSPGELEQDTLGVITGAPGELEQDIGGAVEGTAQPVIGPAGEAEQAVGGAVWSGAGALADVGTEAAVGTADLAGDIGAFWGAVGASIPSGDILTGEGVMDEAGDIFRAPEDERSPQTIGEQGIEMGVGAATRAANEVTFSLPENILRGGQLAGQAAEFTAGEMEEEGVVGGAQAAAGVGGTVAAGVAAQQGRGIIQNPFESGIEAVTGGRFARVGEGLATRARARAETRGETGFDLEDVDSSQGQPVQTDRFETDPQAPAGVARAEVESRALEQPTSVQDQLGDSILWRSDPTRGDFEDIGEGASELPGLFTTPDVPTLRLDTYVGSQGVQSGTSLQPRIPFLGGATRPQRMAGFEAPDIRTMPESAGGSGYAVYRGGEAEVTGLARWQARDIVDEGGGQMRPDPTTAGYEFLTEDATPGAAYTRASSDRSPELEAVYPPDSEFVRTTTAGPVDIPGGRPGTADLYRRVTESGDVEGTDLTRADIPEGAIATGDDIVSQTYRDSGPEGQPVTPPLGAPGATTQDGADTTGAFTTGTQPTGTTNPFSTPDVTVGSGTTTGTGGFGTGVTTDVESGTTGTTGTTGGTGGTTGGSGSPSGTSGIPTGGTGTPSGPTGSPPSQPPSAPPSAPPSPPFTPPSSPPASPPFGPPSAPPETPPRTQDDSDDEDVGFLPTGDVAPTGTEYENPIITGGQFLFGGSLGETSDDEESGINNPFIG